jgi:hypothetical protein
MKTNYLLSIFLIGLIFQNCASIVYPQRDNMKSLKGGLEPLDGFYANLSAQNTGDSIAMWAVLTKKYQSPEFTGKFDFSNSIVKLTSQRRRRVLAELIVADTVKETLILKGHVTDDYFSLRRKIKYFGLPFVFLTWFDYKLQLGLDNNNELHIDGNNGRLGWVFIIAAGNKEDYNFTYRKM